MAAEAAVVALNAVAVAVVAKPLKLVPSVRKCLKEQNNLELNVHSVWNSQEQNALRCLSAKNVKSVRKCLNAKNKFNARIVLNGLNEMNRLSVPSAKDHNVLINLNVHQSCNNQCNNQLNRLSHHKLNAPIVKVHAVTTNKDNKVLTVKDLNVPINRNVLQSLNNQYNSRLNHLNLSVPIAKVHVVTITSKDSVLIVAKLDKVKAPALNNVVKSAGL